MLGERLSGILFASFGLIGIALIFWRARRFAKQAIVKDGERRPILIFHEKFYVIKYEKFDFILKYAIISCWLGGLTAFFLR